MRLDHEKRKAIAAGLARGLSAKEAAIDAGYAEKYAASFGPTIARSPQVQKELKRILSLSGKGATGEKLDKDKVFLTIREIFESKEEPSMVRLKAIEVLNKMMGWNEPEKLEVTHVIRDDLETKLKKCTRLLVENGYKVIPPPKEIVLPIKEGKK